MRPGSRKGTPTSSARPNSGQRPIGTAMGSAARPSSGRLRTGQVPSTSGKEAVQGVSVLREVQVADRPVTQHGMMGMKAGGSGYGRQVQDATYYSNAIRKRITDVSTELQRLREELQQISKDSTQYGQLERKYESVEEEVRNLEGQLADYNLARDKARTSTDPEEVRHAVFAVREKNLVDEQELDRVFLAKQQRERATKELETELSELHRQAEEKINRLEPAKLSLYRKLLQMSRSLQDEAHRVRTEIQIVTQKIREHEGDPKVQAQAEVYRELERKLVKLQKEKQMHLQEMEIARLEPKAAHSHFIARVKADNARIIELEQRTKILSEDLARIRRNITELSDSRAEGTSADRDTIDKLIVRDKEMTVYIDSSEAMTKATTEEHAQIQSTIVALLEDMSRGLEEQNALPDVSTVQDMKEQQSFKMKNLETSMKTQQSLQRDLRKREDELRKVEELKPRMENELKSLSERMRSMQGEVRAFDDTDGLRKKFEQTQSYLAELKRSYIRRRDGIRQQVSVLSSEHEGLKRELASNEYHRMLEDLEKKMRHKEQGIFALREYVDSKQNETDYAMLKEQSLKALAQLNQLNIQQEEKAGGMY